MSLADMKIVADSSADTFAFPGVPYAFASLKIRTDENEYVDNDTLDVAAMVNELLRYSGKSSTSCPSVGDWLDAFGDAKEVFCITITSNLSGSYNSACTARQTYEEMHPDRRIHVIDSLSAGPELRLIMEKLRELMTQGLSFDDIRREITAYQQRTGLLFVLESMRNLANNGRVSHLAAKAAGVLGIRAVGKASDHGTLEMLSKERSAARARTAVRSYMSSEGYAGGKVRIGHCLNVEAAEKLAELIRSEYPEADIEYYPSTALCSFYQEKGGLMIGFEKG